MNVRDGVTVRRRAELVGQRFEAPNLAKMLGRTRFGNSVDLHPWVAEIREKAADLAVLADAIHEATRAADRARIERKRAKEVYDRLALRGARIFEDVCRFSGLDDLAARVRRAEGAPHDRGRENPPARAEDSPPEVPESSSIAESLTTPGVSPGGPPGDRVPEKENPDGETPHGVLELRPEDEGLDTIVDLRSSFVVTLSLALQVCLRFRQWKPRLASHRS